MASAAATAIPVLSRVEQQRHYGVDCGDAIHFAAGTWLPGGEHVHKIVVKNVSRRTIKFKYELPTTKYFSMDFPTLITLSPGMQTVLDVAFRPVKVEEYDDFVTFHVQIIEGGVAASSGRFRLPVLARIAGLAVEIPRGLDFGFCPTAETSQLAFTLRNTGQVDLAFDWRIPGAGGEHGRPFAVHPAAGRVSVGASVELTASFAPTMASVYVTTTVCTVRPVAEDSTLSPCEETMKLSGISKFTHIAASEKELNFGEILVGAGHSARAPTEKEFVLRNRSLVRASFEVRRVESDCDAVFVFSPTSGVVPPESSVTVRVRYTPTSAGAFTCDHFDIVTPGGNRERVTCKGRAVGPTVSLWKKNLEANFVRTRSVNFGDVVVGKSCSRVLTLRNESPIDVFFHFDAQANGVFAFDKVTGRLAPLLDLNVTITFTPQRVGNFYRRFFLLLQHQTALFVDVLGTSYDDKVRPSPFQQAHVDAYRLRAASGLGLLSPDQLETYWQENGDALFRRGALQRSGGDGTGDGDPTELLAPQARAQLLTRSGEASLADVDTCHEFFVGVDDRRNAIIVQSAFLDFGNCGIVQFPSKKVLHVTNQTHGKVTCAWRVASAATSDATSAFQVFPESLDISAGATAEFRVAFQPSTENSYYFAELEGYVSFKSNRTFRLVNVETFTPPWSVVAKVCGNTFASPTEQFLSKVTFRLPRKNRVVFPPCYLGDSVFQTVLLENAGDTPALFSFLDDPSRTFQCKPSSGYIAAKSFHLVQIRFEPRKAKSYHYPLQCVINNARGSPETLELAGVAALPALTFHEDGDTDLLVANDPGSPTKKDARVFIKPTAVGLQSERTAVIANASRVPLVFRWDIPHKLQDVFEVSPKLGRLNGRESVAITYRFTPQETRAYASRFTVAVKPISVAWSVTAPSQPAPVKVPVLQEATVRVQTKGTAGAVAFEPETAAFETILVNTSAKKTIYVVNSADCDLQFALAQTLRVASDDATNIPTGAQPPAALAFSESRGLIPARSRKQIAVTFLPRVAGVFEFDVSCHTFAPPASTATDRWRVAPSHVQHCRIHAEASFPTIVIDDIRVPNLPTALAWPQFLCQEINDYMNAPPSSASMSTTDHENGGPETATQQQQPHDDGEQDEMAGVKHVAVAFSPAPLGAAAQCVYLKLRNPGRLVVDFALRYPKEGHVEMEHWAETGAPSSDEIRTNAIIDSRVFEISPRRATLLPQQSVTLALRYAFASDAYGGVHDLPVLLQVDKGKKLVLELQGRTLPRNEPKLFLSRRAISLSPVMIGEYRRPFPSHDDDDEDREEEVAAVRRPPLQQILVSNRGDAAFRLDVSSNSFAKINTLDHGGFYPVLRCVTSSEIVAAHSSVYVDLEFAPLEAKTIEANLIIKAHGLMGRAYKEVAMVTILATGFHPLRTSLAALRRELALAVGGSAPERQRLTVPGQSVRLECDRADFGHVPAYAQRTQLLVLVNRSGGGASGTVAFAWDASHPLVSSGVVGFSPVKGELRVGEEALVRVTITTTARALVVDHHLACRITPVATDTPAGSVPPAASPTKRNLSTKSVEPLAHVSVTTRSTATQAAAIERGQGLGATSPINRKGGGNVAPVAAAPAVSSVAVSYPVFAHVCAHVLPRELFERFYPHDVVATQPLPYVTPCEGDDPRSTPSLPPRRASSPKEIEACQQVVMDVMETLFMDVLSSDAVQHAVDAQQQFARPSAHAASAQPPPPMVYRHARQSEDCAAIASTVLENTVFNILQELFHGDIEQELACVPRKAVFPKASSPRKASTAAAH